jgi:hypothetical protein
VIGKETSGVIALVRECKEERKNRKREEIRDEEKKNE